ncbi:MAG: DNA polymerase I [Planctomycetia bacterium]|nr:MAG: DNA polymerase I [Planctomycetia bacterium]
MTRSLYIIDGHAQIYRAYFAPFGNLSSPTGEPTRATHVFYQMLINLVRDRKPDYVAMVLDSDEDKLERKRLYPAYKEHRDPAPEDLPIQSRRIVQILEALRMRTLRQTGHEADDIIATLCAQLTAAAPDLHVYIVSRDKDLEQLLSDRVSLFDPLKNEVTTPERLLETKGWTPEQAVEAQTLMGDSVDNVPGVPGIGPKTAAKLIQKYGTADAVVAHADELTPKQRDAVRAFAAQLPITRQLVTLRRDVPLRFELEDARSDRLDWDAVKPIFTQLGFRRLVEQVPGRAVAADGGAPPSTAADVPAPPVAAIGPRSADAGRTVPSSVDADESDSDVSGDQAGAEFMAAAVAAKDPRAVEKADAALREPSRTMWKLIANLEDLDALVREMADCSEFCVDTETTSVNPIDAELVGIALSWRVGSGCYIPILTSFGTPLAIEEVRPRLGPLLADARIRKIGHHLKYDLLVLEQAGLEVRGPLFDSMIAAFLCDPLRNSFGLDSLARVVLDHEMIPITDLIGKGRDQLRMDQVQVEHVAEYAAEDADFTLRLARHYEPRLEREQVQRLFHEVEMPLMHVLARMEEAGISLDAEFLRVLSGRMAARADELVTQIHALAGVQFNVDSPKQLGEVLFDKLGFRVVKRTRTTRSTDAEVLETLAAEGDNPLPALLLEYRELQKLRGTYVDALPAARSARTGRVHTSFHQTGAVTGRLSSSEPNLQNIPIRTELGREIRRAFVPRSREELLIVADYSQIELRVLAHFSEDEQLIAAFAQDADIHIFVAAQVNNVPIERVTKEMRSRAKAVNFGIIYGQTAFGLARGTGMSRPEAQRFIDDYFARYPRVRGFMDRIIADARRDGGVRTILGRWRPIWDIESRNAAARAQAERLAVNTVMQGSAADLIKVAMVRLQARIEQERLPLRLLLQVHDELVCEGARSRAEELSGVVREVMSGAMALRVPLKVDVACGENWLESK